MEDLTYEIRSALDPELKEGFNRLVSLWIRNRVNTWIWGAVSDIVVYGIRNSIEDSMWDRDERTTGWKI